MSKDFGNWFNSFGNEKKDEENLSQIATDNLEYNPFLLLMLVQEIVDLKAQLSWQIGAYLNLDKCYFDLWDKFLVPANQRHIHSLANGIKMDATIIRGPGDADVDDFIRIGSDHE